MKRTRWRLTLNDNIARELAMIESEFHKTKGRPPSKSEIVGLLVTNIKGKKLKRKSGKIICT